MNKREKMSVATMVERLRRETQPFSANVFTTSEGYEIPIRVYHCPKKIDPSTPLVICFHGAVNRSVIDIPVFEGRFLTNALENRALLISVADPILETSTGLIAAWYAGSHDVDLPLILRKLFGSLTSLLGHPRTIFVAGSVGAHAALLQSWYAKGSIAVVENPILSISGYNPAHIKQYREACWPNLGQDESFPPHIVDYLQPLYGKGFPNTVIYLQNSRDHHFWTQTVEMLSMLKQSTSQEKSRFLFLSEFFAGYGGHSYPIDNWSDWVCAACFAATTQITDIGELAVQLRTPQKISKGAASLSPSDIELAERILRETSTGKA